MPQKTGCQLVGVSLLRETVYSAICSGRVKGEPPVSLLFIAAPERGKTSIVLERQCPAIIVLTDATGRGIQQLCQANPEVSHFIVNDMVTLMSHRQNVNRYTLSILNAMLEEGIRAVAFPGTVETFSHGKRGIIACVTPGMMRDGRAWWHRTGFATRLLPFAYDYPNELILKIHAAIREGVAPNWTGKSERLRVPKTPKKISVPSNVARRIQRIAVRVAEKLSENRPQQEKEAGFRRHKQLRSLACGHALYHGRTVATQEDADFLEQIEPYISYTRLTVIEDK